MKVFSILLFLIASSCNVSKVSKVYSVKEYNNLSFEYEKVSLNKLMDNPQLYEGKKIESKGKFHFTIETSSLSEDGSMYGGIWIDFISDQNLIDENGNNLKKLGNRGDLSGHKVKIKGEFTSKKRGHLAAFKGSLKNIVYFEVIR